MRRRFLCLIDTGQCADPFTLLLADLRNGGAFKKSISLKSTPLDFSGEKNLFHTNIKCPIKAGISITPSASVSVDVDANVHASIGIGAVAAGTIIPPKITDFGLDFGTLYSVLELSSYDD